MPLALIREKILNALGKKIYKHFDIECPKIRLGEFSTNICMKLYRDFNCNNPYELGQILMKKLQNDHEIEQISIAAQGFININMSESFWKNILESIDDNYGSDHIQQKVNVEYVSANPTGPLHIGHIRTGIVGDIIANIFEFAGYQVTREFYVNDCGMQIEKLSESISHYMHNKPGDPPYYANEYIKDLAKRIKVSDIPDIKIYSVMQILESIKSDLQNIKIIHDNFVFESEIQELLPEVEQILSEYISYQDIESDQYTNSNVKVLCLNGKRKILQKSNGDNTYFAQDLAYHKNKIDRGFDIIINIQGCDHIDNIDILEKVLNILNPKVKFYTVLCQMVSIIENDKISKMSKRAGNIILLQDMLKHISADMLRYALVSNSANSHYNIDYAKLNSHNESNKFFYVQYAYARSVSFLKQCKYRELHIQYIKKHIEIVRKICIWKDIIYQARIDLSPCYIITYLNELAQLFHNLWSNEKMLGEDQDKNEFYAALIYKVQKIFNIAFKILNIRGLEKL